MLSWCDNPRSSYVLLSSCEGIGWSFLGATVKNIVVEENKEALNVLYYYFFKGLQNDLVD